MSQRERWIVYPLLFFSFALAIRDQVPEWRPAPDFNVVTCHQLIVKDSSGGVAVDIHAQPRGPNAGSGVVVVNSVPPEFGTGRQKAVRIGVAHRSDKAQDAYGIVETLGPLGSPATQWTSDKYGGAIGIYDRAGKLIHRLELLPHRARAEPQHETVDADDPRKVTPRPPKPEADSETKQDEAASGAGRDV